jgi:sulfate-transporting ATPase
MESLWQFGILGLVTGGAYALIGLGILAVYKGSRVVNLAQGALGMVGCYIFWEFYRGGDGLPVAVSMILAVAISALLGALLYLCIMRLVRDAAESVRMITTLGILVTLQAIAALRYGSANIMVGQIFGESSFRLFGATVTTSAVVVLASVAILGIGIAVIFRKTRLGANAAALQDNSAAAGALGISPHPTGTITWALGSGAASIAAIVLVPATGLSPTQLNGSLVAALAAVLLAKFSSVGITVLAALAFGVFESIGLDKGLSSSVTSAVPFIIIVLVLLARGTTLPGRDDVKYRLPAIGTGRIQIVPTIVVLAIAFALIGLAGPTWRQAIITTAVMTIIALSVVVVTGYAGQLSLAPLAMAGLSALVTGHLAHDWSWGFVPSIAGGVVAAGVVGVVFGLPASRVRGANLAIITLGLAMVIETVFLTAPRFTGGIYGLTIPAPSLFGLDISPAVYSSRYATLCVVVAAVVTLIVVNIRSNASGRRYAAIRASERGAAALGVSVAGTKVAAFATSGLLAGLGGGLLAYRFTTLSLSGFGFFSGLQLVGLVIVGGVAYISGSLFAGILTLGGISSVFFINTLGLSEFDPYMAVITGVMIILTMAFIPDGQVPMNVAFWKPLLARVAAPLPTMKRRAGGADEAAARANDPAPAAEPKVLTVAGVGVRFGGVKALSDVSFTAEPGKVLGIIGPNGAGKTTLIDVISGFRKPSDGQVDCGDRTLSAGRPSEAIAAGIARTFQNLELFDDLTVRENLQVATEQFRPWTYFRDGFFRKKTPLPPETYAALARFGLADALDERVENLPQGKRRLLAVARALSQRPSVICLDEPAAGVSPAERPELGAMIRSFATEQNMSVILVEHDVDLVASVCDELLVLNFGQEIARGIPAEVLERPVVRAAYLGETDTGTDTSTQSDERQTASPDTGIKTLTTIPTGGE